MLLDLNFFFINYTLSTLSKVWNFMQVCHVLTLLTGNLHSVGTTRGSPSQSQTSATQASRNTKSPQCPTPHSATPRSSKSTGKVLTPNFLWVREGLDSHGCPLICVELQQPPVFTWQHATASS